MGKESVERCENFKSGCLPEKMLLKCNGVPKGNVVNAQHRRTLYTKARRSWSLFTDPATGSAKCYRWLGVNKSWRGDETRFHLEKT